LTTSHVASLFGVQNAAVTNSLTIPELMVFRTEEDFIEHVWQRAERVATNANRTANDLGYDRAKISALYRQIIRRMHTSSENPFAPRFREWESLRNDLISFGKSRHMVASPDAKDALETVVQNLKQRIADDDVTKIILEPSPQPLADSSLEELGAQISAFQDMIGSNQLDEAEDMLNKNFDRARRNKLITATIEKIRDAKRVLLDNITTPPIKPIMSLTDIDDIHRRFSIHLQDNMEIVEGAIPRKDIFSPLQTFEYDYTANLPTEILTLINNWRTDTVFNEVQQEIRDEILDKFINDPRVANYVVKLREMLRKLSGGKDEIMVFRGSSGRGGVNVMPGEAVTVSLKPSSAESFASMAEGRRAARGTVPDIDGVPQKHPDDTGVLWEAFNVPIDTVYAMGDVLEAELIIRAPGKVPDTTAIDETLDRLAGMLGRNIEPPTPVGTRYQDARTAAFRRAQDEFNLNMPNYDNPNAFNAAMRFIFPFWTYEAHRWSFLPRVAVRTPGVYHAWGSYNDTSDQGYISIGKLPFQVNPLRNTIAMGGGRRILNRDYPDFYDQFPELANLVDQSGRYGFYPNIYVSGFMASSFSNKEGIWQTGEIMPPTFSSAMNALSAAAPDNVFVRGLRELLLPNRFRDFKKVRLTTLAGGNGATILNKIKGDVPLSDIEKAQWDAAERRTALLEIFDIQTGLFRLKPQELDQARELAKQIIINWPGYPMTEELYDEARKMGYSPEEFMAYPPGLNDELNSVEEIARWRGQSSHLRESGVGREIGMLALFWDGVETRRTEINLEALELDSKLKAGTLSLDRWEFERKALRAEMSGFIEERKLSEMFAGIDIDFEDRVAFAQKHNTLPPIRSPQEELVAMYFEAEPDNFEFFNDDTGKFEIDWVGFYAYRTRMEDALPRSELAEFKKRISKWDTQVDLLRRSDYEEYITPYKAVFSTVLEGYNEEQTQVIREFYSSDSSDRREILRNVLMDENSDIQLIADFQSKTSKLKRIIRRNDPEMDARLTLWGETTTPVTEEAKIIQRRLWSEYGFKGREANL
jgi:hypothetical protein